MGGSIELKSKVGVGTTVIVKIPFKIGTQDNNSNLSDKPVCLDDYSVEGMNVHLAKPLDAEKMIVALKQCMADNSDIKLHEDL